MDHPSGDHEPGHISKTEARAGTTPHSARYVLVISTAITIILFAVILFYFLW